MPSVDMVDELENIHGTASNYYSSGLSAKGMISHMTRAAFGRT